VEQEERSMTAVVTKPEDFAIVGENIHTTRIVLRDGKRHRTLDDGAEIVTYTDPEGNPATMSVPDWYKSTQPYEQGQIKHFMIAVRGGTGDDETQQAEGRAYVQAEALRQIKAGAAFLDVNVDEVSYKLDIQIACMRWMVNAVQEVSTVPLSIDSSNAEIIAAGMAECDASLGRPMINSVALERPEVFDLVVEHNGRAIITAAGESGMPSDANERVANVTRLIEEATKRGIGLSDLFVDLLVFPISVDGTYGRHFLDAVEELRRRYGTELHVTGGLSNVSFGLPMRKLINDTFIRLCIESGADSGIIDPIQSKVDQVLALDLTDDRHAMAMDMLEGRDDFCMNFIGAYKKGRLKAKAPK
jgi:cobalamin-dependent methionine synthase I